MKSVLQIFVIIAQFLLFIPVADKHSSNEVRQPRFGIIDNFFSKKAKTLIIMINIANNSLVNTQTNIPKVYTVKRKLGHNGRHGNLIWSF